VYGHHVPEYLVVLLPPGEKVFVDTDDPLQFLGLLVDDQDEVGADDEVDGFWARVLDEEQRVLGQELSSSEWMYLLSE
jgi:hypothetical protein